MKSIIVYDEVCERHECEVVGMCSHSELVKDFRSSLIFYECNGGRNENNEPFF